MSGAATKTPATPSRKADPTMLKKLRELGYLEADAREALEMTNSKSIDLATGFLRAGGKTPRAGGFTKAGTPQPPPTPSGNTPAAPAPPKKISPTTANPPIPAPPKGKAPVSASNSDEEFLDYSDDDEDFLYESDADPDDAYGLNTQESAAPTADFVVLSGEEIIGRQKTEIAEVSEVLSLPLASAGALLRACQWNKEKVITGFFEDPDAMSKKAGILVLSPSSPSAAAARPGAMVTCRICFDDEVKVEESLALDCAHRFCNECYSTYMTKKIMEDGEASGLHCPEPKCEVLVPDTAVKALVPPTVYDKYYMLLCRSFVEDNPRVKWCPAPGCTQAARSHSVKTTLAITCSCGHRWCFGCGEEAHNPAMCSAVKEWLRKTRDDSETANWIQANTNDCPKCNAAIEKNGGCNHMTCRKCKHEFCWVCFGDWKSHNNNYSCNKFDEGKKAKQSSSRAALDRYLFYFHRFSNHEKSSKFEAQIRVNADKRMQEMQSSNKSTWIDVQYLSEACDTLLECRRTLKFTYVMAYFMQDSANKQLFEMLQQDLEANTERLSFFLEAAPLDQLDRLEVMNCTRLAKTRLENLFKGVEDGLGDGATPQALAAAESGSGKDAKPAAPAPPTAST